MKRKKIAVLRANALGDFIFVLPALQLLRATFPDAEIFYLGRRMHETLLKERPGPIDHVIVIPPCPGVGEPEDLLPDENQLEAFFACMQAEKFDIAIQLHGGGRYSNPFILKLGAAFTIGLGTPDAVPLDMTIPYITYFHETLRYLEVVSCLNIHLPKPTLTITERDLQEAENILSCQNKDQPYAIIHPGASDVRRRWPPEYFAQTADFLVSRGWIVYINGIKEEAWIAKDIMAKMKLKYNTYNLCGKASLNALIGLIAHSGLLISNDSGPLHVANILQKPAVGIYWVGNMITGMPLASANFRPVISWTTSCPVCGMKSTCFDTQKNGCEHATSFVASIAVEEVKAAIIELMNRKKNQKQEYSNALIN